MPSLSVDGRAALLGLALLAPVQEASAEPLTTAIAHRYYISTGVLGGVSIGEEKVDAIYGAELTYAARLGFLLPWVGGGVMGHGDSFVGYLEGGFWAALNIGVGAELHDGEELWPYLYLGAPIPLHLGVWRRNWLLTAQPWARVQLDSSRPHSAGLMFKWGIPLF